VDERVRVRDLLSILEKLKEGEQKMNPYCQNCGEDGDVWMCDICGKQKCSDCITNSEYMAGVCKEHN